MRIILWVVFAAAFLWAGYWFVGSRAMETGLVTWLEDRQEEGWLAEYTTLNTRGFPNRFDTVVTDLELADPRTGVAWSLPKLEILMLSYKPNHIIAVMPNTQTIASPNERITITNDDMRGSVVFQPDTSLSLLRSVFEIDNATFTSTKDWTATIKAGQFATKQTVARKNAHDVLFSATDVGPSKNLLARLDPAGVLPKIFETLRIETTLGFDAKWDRLAIERARPQVTDIDLKILQANWGPMDLYMAGELTVDAAGIPTGTITVRAQNWREMLSVAVAAGAVPQNISKTVESALNFLASMSGNPKTLDAPLTFQGGKISFGPIPLGPAPRIVIR